MIEIEGRVGVEDGFGVRVRVFVAVGTGVDSLVGVTITRVGVAISRSVSWQPTKAIEMIPVRRMSFIVKLF